jgi:hypothetical protein
LFGVIITAYLVPLFNLFGMCSVTKRLPTSSVCSEAMFTSPRSMGSMSKDHFVQAFTYNVNFQEEQPIMALVEGKVASSNQV